MGPSLTPLILTVAGLVVGVIVVAGLAVWRARRAPPLPRPLEEALGELLEGLSAEELRGLLPPYAATSIWVRGPHGQVDELDAEGYCRAVLSREIRGGTEIRVGESAGPPWLCARDDVLFAFLQRVRAFEQELEAQFADVEALTQALAQHVGAKRFIGRVTAVFVLLIVILVLCMMLMAYYGLWAKWAIGGSPP